MTRNNILTLIYHGIWYVIVVSFYLLDRLRGILVGIAPDPLTRGMVLAIATVIFSLIFTALFMNDQGSLGDNFNSNSTLVILDVIMLIAAGIGFFFNRVSIEEILPLVAMVVVQFLVILLVMRLKRVHHE